MLLKILKIVGVVAENIAIIKGAIMWRVKLLLMFVKRIVGRHELSLRHTPPVKRRCAGTAHTRTRNRVAHRTVGIGSVIQKRICFVFQK